MTDFFSIKECSLKSNGQLCLFLIPKQEGFFSNTGYNESLLKVFGLYTTTKIFVIDLRCLDANGLDEEKTIGEFIVNSLSGFLPGRPLSSKRLYLICNNPENRDWLNARLKAFLMRSIFAIAFETDDVEGAEEEIERALRGELRFLVNRFVAIKVPKNPSPSPPNPPSSPIHHHKESNGVEKNPEEPFWVPEGGGPGSAPKPTQELQHKSWSRGFKKIPQNKHRGRKR